MIGIKQIAFIGLGTTAVAGSGVGIYYLKQDNSIRSKLISENINLISSEEEYWVAFKENKNHPDFINLIKNGDENTDSWDMRKGGNALKAWFEENLAFSSTHASLEKVRKYCAKPPMTIEEKMKKLDKKWVDKWDKKLEELSKPNIDGTLSGELSKIDQKITALDKPDKETVFKVLENWCKGNKEKKLINPTTDEIWTKLEKRCFATTTTSDVN